MENIIQSIASGCSEKSASKENVAPRRDPFAIRKPAPTSRPTTRKSTLAVRPAYTNSRKQKYLIYIQKYS